LNAKDYAELIKKILSSFQYLENKPHFPYSIEIPETNPSFLRWQAQILLQDNLCLSVKEAAIFDEDGMVDRNFSYDLRDSNTHRMIWRIDNHGTWQPIGTSCHVHMNPDNEKEIKEHFPDSKQTIFPYVMRCMRKHFEQEPQDWEVNHDDETE
jgi:hypothetical protein